MRRYVCARPGPILAFGAVAALVLALSGCGSTPRASAPPATKQSASSATHDQTSGSHILKETAKEGAIGNITPPPPLPKGQVADPDSLNMGGDDISWVVTALGRNRYALHLTNTSRVGFIDEISWKPPLGDRIESVGHSTVGSCSLTGGSVACGGLHLKPPACLCRPGGTATVSFSMTSAPNTGVQTSRLQILAMTPVVYNIPSAIGERKST